MRELYTPVSTAAYQDPSREDPTHQVPLCPKIPRANLHMELQHLKTRKRRRYSMEKCPIHTAVNRDAQIAQPRHRCGREQVQKLCRRQSSTPDFIADLLPLRIVLRVLCLRRVRIREQRKGSKKRRQLAQYPVAYSRIEQLEDIERGQRRARRRKGLVRRPYDAPRVRRPTRAPPAHAQYR